METEQNSSENIIAFRVDAGLIDRLGRELVGKAETAVSELIKNSYDADATEVNVQFVNPYNTGGTLIIQDNGLGMTLTQLRKGFMTISSTDKVHHPKSDRFGRSKAGRKGIGRFATQRLGKKLTIITQTEADNQAIKLVINWDDYKIDTNLTDIPNQLEYVTKTQKEGTTLIIDNLREWWSDAAITRVYRYVSDLLQPNYLSDRSKNLGLAKQVDESFKVRFTQKIDGVERVVADPQKMIFDKALAVIEGYVDQEHNGFCKITSSSLDVSDELIPILHNYVYKEEGGDSAKESDVTEGDETDENTIEQENSDEVKDPKYRLLNEVHFKVYYFIYNREDYYNNISKIELSSIKKIANEQGGIRLYRNGFRVLPYGEPSDDWLNIDKRYSSESGTNAPFGNRNLFGFVEIIDPTGKIFEETASREGLIENNAYVELRDFVHKALSAARDRLKYGVEKVKREVEEERLFSDEILRQNIPLLSKSIETSTLEKLDHLSKNIYDLINLEVGTDSDSQLLRIDTQKIFDQLKYDFQRLLDELGMLRVLAGLGLTIGEFTHEVVQFSPSIMGDLSVLSNQNLNSTGINSLENLKRTIQLFTSYTSYFNATVSANTSRELKPQKLDVVINQFKEIVETDLEKLEIDFDVEFYGYNLVTTPMHASEWSSILFNLYTNSKKAIKRHEVQGKLKIVAGSDENIAYVEFSDNGDGIPEKNRERIFDAFFTTSSPVGFDAPEDEKLTGTGLGLKIVKDIVQTYGGTIELIAPELGYSTCFRIEVPLATEKQKEEHGI